MDLPVCAVLLMKRFDMLRMMKILMFPCVGIVVHKCFRLAKHRKSQHVKIPDGN